MPPQPQPQPSAVYTTHLLKSYPDLSYKLKILIFDLCNVAHNRTSQQRLESATDVLYLSPYFTDVEAEIVRGAVVVKEMDGGRDGVEGEGEEGEGGKHDQDGATLANVETNTETATDKDTTPASAHTQTVEQAINAALATFFEKRRASGDARPCGPHTLAPVYLEVFGLRRGDVADEGFLKRMRRQGVPVERSGNSGEEKERKGHGKEKKGHGKSKGEKGKRKK
jgi:hypothetical protein